MIDWTKPIATEEGYEAKLVFTDETAGATLTRLVVIKREPYGVWESKWFHEMGQGALINLRNTPAKETRTVWIRFWKCGDVSASWSKADRSLEASGELLAQVERQITFTHGEGLEE